MSRTDVASRVVEAPVERVFRALIDRAEIEQWLPPNGMTGVFEYFDLRPGGGYRLVMSYGDVAGAPGKTTSNADVVEARFVEITRDVRVVQAVDFLSDDPAFVGTMTMTWAVGSADGGTLVTITAVNVPDGISAEDHDAGLASSLANLAAHLSTDGSG
jgi:uncharacterized protein YndB with AHSA1/START domain